jgi:quercetin dioxygenase-like cupin family protein
MSCLHTIEQPPHWSHTAPDGAYFNRMYLKEKGTLVPQHSHTEPHTTLLVQGKLRAWRENELLGDFEGPTAIYIPAMIKHTFQSLEPETLAYCVFSKSPVMHEEHQISKDTN